MNDDLSLPPAPWWRPTFVCAGLLLLGIGTWVNGERLGLVEESEHSTHVQAVAHVRAPEPEPVLAPPSQDAIPQMARNFDPEMMARNAGILGMIQKDSGHFLASPYGGAFAVGNDDEDVWGGGVSNPLVDAREDARSTFSIDVDTASYSSARRRLVQDGWLPSPESVRTEEFINYFDYDYAQPEGDAPFSVTTEVGSSPWDPSRRLVHVGLQGKVLEQAEVPRRNLVFLVDVSGSMASPERLPLVKHGLSALTEQLEADDWISIVVYAGGAGTVLPPTRGDRKAAILEAIEGLVAGGSTNGAGGIAMAYRLARTHFIAGGVNRVILATDGDFNVGPSSTKQLVAIIEKQRRSGVYLSVLGFDAGDVADEMMERIADHGNGNYAYVDGEVEARKVFVEESGAMLHAIAKDVKVQVTFDPTRVVEHRLVGYENRKLEHRDFTDDTKDAGEIGAGHSVTALYEVVTTKDEGEGPIASVRLRYKAPEGAGGGELGVEVRDEGHALAQTSDDFRFAAAVAAFAQKLKQEPMAAKMTYAEVLALAEDCVGEDEYKREFLELVRIAGRLSAEPESESEPEPEPEVVSVPVSVPMPVSVLVTESAPPQDEAFVLEVLRLLPPLLAFPLFILAFRNRRRPLV